MKIGILLVTMVCLFASCSSERKSNDSLHKVEIANSDTMCDYYIMSNPQKFVSGASLDTSDLHYGGHLLLTQGGILKAIKYGSNWHEVEDYRSSFLSGGWYKVDIDFYSTTWDNTTLSLTVYTKQRI